MPLKQQADAKGADERKDAKTTRKKTAAERAATKEEKDKKKIEVELGFLTNAWKSVNGTLDFEKLAERMGEDDPEVVRERFRQVFADEEDPPKIHGNNVVNTKAQEKHINRKGYVENENNAEMRRR